MSRTLPLLPAPPEPLLQTTILACLFQPNSKLILEQNPFCLRRRNILHLPKIHVRQIPHPPPRLRNRRPNPLRRHHGRILGFHASTFFLPNFNRSKHQRHRTAYQRPTSRSPGDISLCFTVCEILHGITPIYVEYKYCIQIPLIVISLFYPSDTDTN